MILYDACKYVYRLNGKRFLFWNSIVCIQINKTYKTPFYCLVSGLTKHTKSSLRFFRITAKALWKENEKKLFQIDDGSTIDC